MKFTDMLKSKHPPLEQARATVATLEAKAATATDQAATAEAELNAALLAHEEGSIQQAEIAKARKATEAARQTLQDTQGALTGARQRLAEAEQAETDSERETARQAALNLAAERVKVARKLEKDAATLAGSINRLHELSGRINELSYKFGMGTGQIDTAACLIGPTGPFDAIRETLWLHEIEFGSPFSIWELQRRPSLAERLEAAKQHLEGKHTLEESA